MGWAESGFNCWVSAIVLALYDCIECIWNAPTVSLVLLAFDDTGSLGFPPLRVTASWFLAGNRKPELKPTTFSSPLLFLVFLSLFISFFR